MNFVKSVNKSVLRHFCSVESINTPHTPVMVSEVLKYLNPESHQTILDMTFGAGGHSKKILESANNIKLIALDRDPAAYEYAKQLANKYPSQVLPLLGRFSELPDLLKSHNIKKNAINAILFDFGCSSVQFDAPERGFSLSKSGPLDMRMDGKRFPNSPTVADILSKISEDDLCKILKVYGEEKHARKIARAIIEARYLFKRFKTTHELADVVDSVLGDQVRVDKLQRRSHNATKTFQALRIFVNNELNEINYGCILAQHYLKIGGRFVAISFHSLEDIIVKRHLLGNLVANMPSVLPLKYRSHTLSVDKDSIDSITRSNWHCLHKGVIVPSSEEIENNPRSRSAKLRAAIKVG